MLVFFVLIFLRAVDLPLQIMLVMTVLYLMGFSITAQFRREGQWVRFIYQ